MFKTGTTKAVKVTTTSLSLSYIKETLTKVWRVSYVPFEFDYNAKHW